MTTDEQLPPDPFIRYGGPVSVYNSMGVALGSFPTVGDAEQWMLWQNEHSEIPMAMQWRVSPEDTRTMLAQVDAVRALHVPWYEVDGIRHDHTVLVSGDEVPASHVCRIGPDHQACIKYGGDPTDDEHEVLACVECRQATPDGAEAGYLCWPCSTARALGAEAGS